ncbi:uncharacterized protein MELLADRAFT_84569 [Melampsora larici-populina 98AG31]|uniref:Uncharacterized protein n=1 Tax=Melampsora larici-populina (strain 98AG31 / pathotype 3-4-7) TaxID=747676 RepID=F4RFU6_MELLP|nr:uncharacterized protein MELLADRAFT_84569 [Melampsora larici-populina 98AG31]EGG08414.1 hypothetical protein MELLADRAFT_84569 [Melampsora larici-populina 98AG31]
MAPFVGKDLEQSQRNTLAGLIQDAYKRGDDLEAESLKQILHRDQSRKSNKNPYVMDDNDTELDKSDGTSVAFVREVVPTVPQRIVAPPVPTEPVSQPILTAADNQPPATHHQPITTTLAANNNGKVTWFEGALSKEELDKAYAIMASKKGTLELENGDVIHNGRILKGGDAQMKQSLAPLSPGLTIILKGLTSYIQWTVFDEEWLVADQKAWSSRTTKSDKKESGEARIYGGEAPVEELTIDYEVWGDCMELFCTHLVACGWKPVAKKFESHINVVKKLRKDFGWMVALRYCKLVRQGVMRETVDKSVGNYAELHEVLLAEAKTTAESYNEHHYKTNPYAPGRPKESICPLTNKSKTSSATNQSTYQPKENRHASSSNYRGNGKGKGGGYKGRFDDGRKRTEWKREDRYGDRYANHLDKSRSPDRRDKNGKPVNGKRA